MVSEGEDYVITYLYLGIICISVLQIVRKWQQQNFNYIYDLKKVSFRILQLTQVVAYTLGIDMKYIKIKTSNSLTAPNDAMSGGSLTSDGVCYVSFKNSKIENKIKYRNMRT